MKKIYFIFFLIYAILNMTVLIFGIFDGEVSIWSLSISLFLTIFWPIIVLVFLYLELW